MESAAHRDSVSTLRDYLGVLWVRKWSIVLAVVLLPLAAVFFSFKQERIYQASSDVLVKRQDLAAALSGIPAAYEDPERFIQTQLDIANVPTLAARVLKAANVVGETPQIFLKESSVTAKPTSDVLTFNVTDSVPSVARRLATEYGRQFTLYRQELDTAAVRSARKEVEAQIARTGAPEGRNSPGYDIYASLVQRRDQLRTLEALQKSSASVIREADDSLQIQPRPIRNGVLGLGLGIIFGIGAAFIWHALDTRLRSAEQIGEVLGLPLLARIPVLPRRLQRKNKLVMVAEPDSVNAEAFRMLRTNLEFVNLERDAQVIMFTSAIEGEGKSTTVVNLAVALARAGRRVSLVDLDLRRPILARFFGLEGLPGLTDVALGHVPLEHAVASVALGELELPPRQSNGHGRRGVDGLLEILPSGPLPPNAGEFVGTQALAEILSELRRRSDLVLIDSPPLLHVGDAMALSAKVDGIVIVTRLKVTRRHTTHELRRVLENTPGAKLGFVVVGSTPGDEYGYGPYAYEPRSPARAEAQRTSR